MHSSNDDRVHSATLRRTGTYEMLGCVVYSEATGTRHVLRQEGRLRRVSGRPERPLAGDQGERRRPQRRRQPRHRPADRGGADPHRSKRGGRTLRRRVRLHDCGGQLPSGARCRAAVEFRARHARWTARHWSAGKASSCISTSSWSSGVGHIAYGNAPIDRADRAADGLREQREPSGSAARERDRVLSAGRVARARWSWRQT